MSTLFLYKFNAKELKEVKMLYNELTDRLQNLTNTKISQQAIGNILGLAQTAISSRIKRDNAFNIDELIKIEQAMGLPMGCLSGVSSSDITLDFYPDVFGSCGSGCMVFSEAKEKLAVTKDIITNYSASNQYSIISARGSSMSPTINDDDKLVIQHNLNEQIIDDTVYLFRYNDELFIKRLVKNVDQIVCISENPRFQDRIIEPKGDNFSIIGKVVGLFRSKV
jgi:phage repressor protein C with HTH and peptisase S24 domain